MNDILFKMVFSNEPYLLIDFASKILDFDAGTAKGFRIINPSISKRDLRDKSPILDILFEINNKQVNLEIQSQKEPAYLDRVLFYATDLVSIPLKRGDLYSSLLETVTINLVNFNIFESKEFKSEIHFMEAARHLSVWSKLRVFIFELPKLPSKFSSDYAPGNWLLAFKAKKDEDLARLAACGDPIMKKLVDSYYSVVRSRKFSKLATMRKMASCDLAQAIHSAREEGSEIKRAELEPIVKRQAAEIADRDKTIADIHKTIVDKDKTIAAQAAEIARLTKKPKRMKS
jgi:predicted transposase/invertase (TIGR01784 family)